MNEDIELTDYGKASEENREKAWQLYLNSFPDHERRTKHSHVNAMSDTRFNCKIAVGKSGDFVGILFYWVHEGMLFIEHIAVNPELRGKNIGSLLVTELVELYSNLTVILEIDPPEDSISNKRLNFYKRLGFVENGYSYIHPSYMTGSKAHPHPLTIMSHGRAISEKEFEGFKDFLFSVLLKYID